FLLARFGVAQANITNGPIIVEAAAATRKGLAVGAIGQAQDVDAVLLGLPALLAGGGVTSGQDSACHGVGRSDRRRDEFAIGAVGHSLHGASQAVLGEDLTPGLYLAHDQAAGQAVMRLKPRAG